MSQVILVIKFTAMFLVVGCFVAFPILLIRFITGFYGSNENRGGFSGGLTGGMLELDRITRPSIEYVEQVREHRVESESIDGD